MEFPADLRYSKEHVWVRVAGAEAVIGITAHAQKELGDVVFVELPKVGAAVAAGKNFGVVESVKAVSDLYAPVSGAVARVNEDLASKPELVNQDPYGAAWMIAVGLSAPDELAALMTADRYQAFLAEIQP